MPYSMAQEEDLPAEYSAAAHKGAQHKMIACCCWLIDRSTQLLRVHRWHAAQPAHRSGSNDSSNKGVVMLDQALAEHYGE